MLVAIATILSFTLAEDSSSLVGNSNDQPYPKRPSSIIRIDLDDFLSINSTISSSADTITTEDEDEDTVVEKLHAPKKNPAVKSMPEIRFVSLLSSLLCALLIQRFLCQQTHLCLIRFSLVTLSPS